MNPIGSIDRYNIAAASATPPTLMEQVFNGIKEPALRLWHKGDNYPKERMLLAIVFAVVAIGIPGILIFQKVQPWIEHLEHQLVPEYSMSWLGGTRMIIAAHELVEYIAGT